MTETEIVTFSDLGLSEATLQALKRKGFEEPTPIQRKTIPILLKGDQDIVGLAQTGTGKTAAFGLPILEKIEPGKRHVQALILAPTRELAIQVTEELNSFHINRNLQVAPIYGGQSIDQQIRKLRQGVDVVVGTPGRIIDHLERKTLNLQNVSYVVLDEADEMLNMGFIEDIESILSKTNKDKRMLLFSATMSDHILSLAKKYMRQYEVVSVQKAPTAIPLTNQIYFEVNSSDKFEALCRIIDSEKDFYCFVFCRTKMDVDQIHAKLVERGYDAEALHGGLSQSQRERILKKFKSKQATLLIATDVAARGIDINNLTHVINYSLPQDPESYIHRIGRTGRAGKPGTAITFITPSEYRKLLFIQKMAKTSIRKEKLPQIKDIISNKISRLNDDLQTILQAGKLDAFMPTADFLLKSNDDPKTVVAALLKLSFKDELDEQRYRQVREGREGGREGRDSRDGGEGSVERQGTTRLFVALGKMDGYSAKKLVDMIQQEAGVEQSRIDDVRIFDKFSFVTVPFEEAETILETFKAQAKEKGGRSLVTNAKKSGSQEGAGGSSGRPKSYHRHRH